MSRWLFGRRRGSSPDGGPAAVEQLAAVGQPVARQRPAWLRLPQLETTTSPLGPITIDVVREVGVVDVSDPWDRPVAAPPGRLAGRVSGLVQPVPSVELDLDGWDVGAAELPVVSQGRGLPARPARAAEGAHPVPGALTSATDEYVAEPRVPDEPWRPSAWLHEAAIERDRMLAHQDLAALGLPLPPPAPMPMPPVEPPEDLSPPPPPMVQRASLAESRRRGIGLHPASPEPPDLATTEPSELSAAGSPESSVAEALELAAAVEAVELAAAEALELAAARASSEAALDSSAPDSSAAAAAPVGEAPDFPYPDFQAADEAAGEPWAAAGPPTMDASARPSWAADDLDSPDAAGIDALSRAGEPLVHRIRPAAPDLPGAEAGAALPAAESPAPSEPRAAQPTSTEGGPSAADRAARLSAPPPVPREERQGWPAAPDPAAEAGPVPPGPRSGQPARAEGGSFAVRPSSPPAPTAERRTLPGRTHQAGQDVSATGPVPSAGLVHRRPLDERPDQAGPASGAEPPANAPGAPYQATPPAVDQPSAAGSAAGESASGGPGWNEPGAGEPGLETRSGGPAWDEHRSGGWSERQSGGSGLGEARVGEFGWDETRSGGPVWDEARAGESGWDETRSGGPAGDEHRSGGWGEHQVGGPEWDEARAGEHGAGSRSAELVPDGPGGAGAAADVAGVPGGSASAGVAGVPGPVEVPAESGASGPFGSDRPGAAADGTSTAGARGGVAPDGGAGDLGRPVTIDGGRLVGGRRGPQLPVTDPEMQSAITASGAAAADAATPPELVQRMPPRRPSPAADVAGAGPVGPASAGQGNAASAPAHGIEPTPGAAASPVAAGGEERAPASGGLAGPGGADAELASSRGVNEPPASSGPASGTAPTAGSAQQPVAPAEASAGMTPPGAAAAGMTPPSGVSAGATPPGAASAGVAPPGGVSAGATPPGAASAGTTAPGAVSEALASTGDGTLTSHERPESGAAARLRRLFRRHRATAPDEATEPSAPVGDASEPAQPLLHRLSQPFADRQPAAMRSPSSAQPPEQPHTPQPSSPQPPMGLSPAQGSPVQGSQASHGPQPHPWQSPGQGPLVHAPQPHAPYSPDQASLVHAPQPHALQPPEQQSLVAPRPHAWQSPGEGSLEQASDVPSPGQPAQDWPAVSGHAPPTSAEGTEPAGLPTSPDLASEPGAPVQPLSGWRRSPHFDAAGADDWPAGPGELVPGVGLPQALVHPRRGHGGPGEPAALASAGQPEPTAPPAGQPETPELPAGQPETPELPAGWPEPQPAAGWPEPPPAALEAHPAALEAQPLQLAPATLAPAALTAAPATPLVFRNRPYARPTLQAQSAVAVTVPASVAGRLGRIHSIDVSDVMVRRGPAVSARAQHLRARAFTEGGVVHLPDEAGPLDSNDTAALLAHELTHVAQQRRLGAALPPPESAEGQQLEAQAQVVEQWFAGDDSPHPPQGIDGLLGAGLEADSAEAQQLEAQARAVEEWFDTAEQGELPPPEVAELLGMAPAAPGGWAAPAAEDSAWPGAQLADEPATPPAGLPAPAGAQPPSLAAALQSLASAQTLADLGGPPAISPPAILSSAVPPSAVPSSAVPSSAVSPAAIPSSPMPPLGESTVVVPAAADEVEAPQPVVVVAPSADELVERLAHDPPRRWMDLDSSEDLDELATRLYDRLNSRLRFDVLVQRERSGTLMDFR